MVFVGGGNMARAIIGGLRAQWPGMVITVVDPSAPGLEALVRVFGVRALAAPDASLKDTTLVVWAVKPQSFAKAALPYLGLVPHALHLSVMAGIRSDTIARATHARHVVRAMPNTPALIRQGITGLFARSGVDAAQRLMVEQVLAPTGQLLWLDDETQLDAVTALSGSGPAYVFYLLEAMINAGEKVGLTGAAAKQLALATLQGATQLAAQSQESPQVLRERVTSQGGTTHAAITVLEQRAVGDAIQAAIVAARDRAAAMGDEFDQGPTGAMAQ